MKALTLWQPWASLVAIGAKPYETRSWAPPDRLIGHRIAIHAAKRDIGYGGLRKIVDEQTAIAIESRLLSHGLLLKDLPRQAIVCTAIIELSARVNVWHEFARRGPPDLFGDYSIGRWIWKLTHVQTFPPIECKGRQGWFDAPEVLG